MAGHEAWKPELRLSDQGWRHVEMLGLPATISWQLSLKTADVAWDEQMPAPHFCPNAEAEHGTLKVRLHLR